MYISKLLSPIRLTLAAALLLLTLAACTQENVIGDGATIPPEPLPGKDAVQIVLSTPKSSSNTRVDNPTQPIGLESYIKNVRILFFKEEEGESDSKNWILEINEMQEVEKDLLLEQNTLKIIIEGIKNRETPRMVFVIANWMNYPAGALKIGVSTLEELATLFSTITQPIPTPTKEAPLLMMGMLEESYDFSLGAAQIKLNRRVAKINLKVVASDAFLNVGLLQANCRPGYNGDELDNEPGSQPSVYLQRVPNSVYIYPILTLPPAYELMEYEDRKPLSNPSSFELTDTYYVYPYYLSGHDIDSPDNPSKAMNVFLSLPLRMNNGELLRNNYYNVVIKNTKYLSHPYVIEPNKIYNLTITLKGFGDTDDGATASLVPEEWPLTDLPADVPIYSLGINKKSVSFLGATNRELVVTSNHLPLVTVTSENPALVTASLNATTGVITLTRQGSTSGETSLKVKLVNLTRSINVIIK